jgi:hypothetical protein
LRVVGHEWSPGNGFAYEMAPDSAALTRRYVEVTSALRDLIFTRGLSASVYTQPTDVENEVNGLYTYDRRVSKMDTAQVLAVNNSVKAAGRGAYLPVNRLISLRVTTSCCTDRYLGPGVTTVVNSGSADGVKRDHTFWVRPGLADAACVSFESRSFPGRFLRHSGYRIRLDPHDGSTLFGLDATFCVREGLADGGTSLESKNYPGRYLRHINAEAYISDASGTNPWDKPSFFAADATWALSTAWWRSGVDLPRDTAQSLRVATPGYTDRYLRHINSLGVTEVVTSGSSDLLKADATFYVRRGLADPTCYSFESRNFPGHYLRHSNCRIRKDPNDGSALFASDATFCAQPGRYGTGNISLESDNYPGYHIRHYAAEVWIAVNGGSHPYDNPGSYDADVSWLLSPPWAP